MNTHFLLCNLSNMIYISQAMRFEWLSIFNTILIICIAIILCIFYLNSKKNQSKTSEPYPLKDETLSPTPSIGISETTKQELIKKLIKFESSELYREKDLTLTKLATVLNTNTKYLSYVIKLHSNRDFNNYINLLRVQYIVNKIQYDPKYINYKISVMADEAGFSSHSKFTHFFKLIIGESPSAYISSLKENNPIHYNEINL
ncbi:helix-turn-helix domain-containing protein [Faecalibacter rhinopitheci]|uniref:Helix-turn-helix domain-containing protein n=1 Tax=Faecalibacter rhinopitheci TaxID=2779678 RepID=A0A8J7KA19_9FLAO|nr:helix-turn-helix domain-containing protein [Faecalibacter rhinopitheci]MBF0596950.1 helix-turn-helix domain-containing protein [Faecalibacter rhinopitheci]